MRTNRIPLLKTGLFSNRYFNIWMLSVVTFFILSININFLKTNLKLISLNLLNILSFIIVTIILMLWIEFNKWIKYTYLNNK
jgi:hypothetical protein